MTASSVGVPFIVSLRGESVYVAREGGDAIVPDVWVAILGGLFDGLCELGGYFEELVFLYAACLWCGRGVVSDCVVGHLVAASEGRRRKRRVEH
jgi:hypothetical protein